MELSEFKRLSKINYSQKSIPDTQKDEFWELWRKHKLQPNHAPYKVFKARFVQRIVGDI